MGVPMRRAKSILALAALALAAGSFAAAAQAEFPFDRDLVVDARPMRGSRRVPILAFTEDGRVQSELWCKRGDGQATIAGDALTLALGSMVDEPCTPERAQADEEMLAT